jgi:hypothetical protein
MSRSAVLVVVPPSIPEDKRLEWVEDALVPFSGLGETDDPAATFSYQIFFDEDDPPPIYPAPDVPNLLEEIFPMHMLTPDNTWHEVDRLLPQPYERWHERVREILAGYPDHTVVVAIVNP